MVSYQELAYHLGAEERKGKPFLVIQIWAQGSPLSSGLAKQFLLAASDPQEKEALHWLINEDLKVQGERPALAQFHVRAEKALEAIKRLSLTRKLYFNRSKLFFDPFSTLSFDYEARQVGAELVELKGKWKSASGSGGLEECQWLFLSEPPLVVKHGTLYAFSGEIEAKWYALVYPQPFRADLAQMQKWQAEWKDDPEWAPACRWVSSEPAPLSAAVQPLPFLELTDRTGAFANLWMDYGPLGKCLYHDPRPVSWRQPQVERTWEKDLLETDFIPKYADKSRYYCPLDKVAKSLTFLLEVGWKIFDHRERQVVRQKGKSIELGMEGERLVVKGKISYESHEADLAHLVGAFNRREQFLMLDAQTVGLIDPVKVDEELGGLASAEVVSGQILMKKNQLGLLGGLLNEASVVQGTPLADAISQLKGEVSIVPVLPLPTFQGNLFPYQQQGLNWLCYLKRLGFSGLLADEMGLGKTVQVLAFFSHLKMNSPTLVVAPTSLLFNWRREIEKFLPGVPLDVHHGPERLQSQEHLRSCGIILTSYALLRQDQELFQSVEYEAVVLDEGQSIKNPDSQIAQAVFGLRSEMRLVLSGTPIENRWEDLWSLFHFLMPDLLGERGEFTAKMAAAASDSRYLQQTKRKTCPFLLRRKKRDVAIDLPERVTQEIWVEMEERQRSLYEDWVRKNQMGVLKKIDLEGASSARMEILEAILRLRQICSHPWLVGEALDEDPLAISGKLQRLIADIEEVAAEGKKVLVYSQFTQMLHLIQREIVARSLKHVYLDGSTKDRESIVRQFQEDPETQVFLISLKAGGVGLNLTAADYVFLYDPWWNEAAEDQAIDRAHRVGRADRVIARRYITAFSIEEKLMRLKEHKRSLAQGILDMEADMPSLTIEDLKDLL